MTKKTPNPFLKALADAGEELEKMGYNITQKAPEIEQIIVEDVDDNSLNVRLVFKNDLAVPEDPNALVSIRLSKFYQLVQDAYLLGAKDCEDAEDDDDTSIN